jgi:hypothetical protein
MPTPTTLISELQESALNGDYVARTVLENPIMGLILKELVESPVPAYIRFSIPSVSLKLSDGKRRLIAGYASVETIDKQNELITIPALQKAWSGMRLAGEQYANINLEHSNITIGKILLDEHVTDSEGVEHWSQVDDKGLYVLCELRQDIDIADRVWDMANKGELNAFSVGGRILPGGKRLKMSGDNTNAGSFTPFWEINDLELYEITVCQRGKNPLSGFSVLKSYLDNGLIDEATYIAKSDELKKGEEIVKELILIPSLVGKSFTLSENFIGYRGYDIGKSDDRNIEILVKMDPEDPMRRFVEKGILKMLPQTLWNHIQFNFKEASALPEETQPLFNLALVPADGLTKAEPGKKEEGHKTKPSEYKDVPDSEFADPTNHKYPIDAAHVQAAWSYINQDKNQAAGGYSDSEWSAMKTRVKAAMKRHGHEVSEEAKKSDSEPTTEPTTVQTNSTLKKTDAEVAKEDDKMSTPIQKTEGTPELAPASSTAKAEPNAEFLQLADRVAKLEASIAKGVPAPMPAPTGGTQNPMSKEDKPCEDPKEDEDKEKACKSDDNLDAGFINLIDEYTAKGGKVPPWLAEKMATSKSMAKADPVAAIAKSVATLTEKVELMAKSASSVDVDKIALKVTELLKSNSQTIRKAEVPQAAPGEAVAQSGPKTLQEIHVMPWAQVDAESDKRRSQALA